MPLQGLYRPLKRISMNYIVPLKAFERTTQTLLNVFKVLNQSPTYAEQVPNKPEQNSEQDPKSISSEASFFPTELRQLQTTNK